ncbi:hypothetical protein JHK85_004210 [Glycine max]|uniref:RNase H type-1 domain-containing protein n=2 Tax=Glycine subgen. Soja TaxID=1462606 RepID=A0A0R0KWL3_SOYBN|nr:hypothetical protein JHK87_003908 [Glycine soja]KAG5063027.1 hypothetical protein JHK85_004210 [Glycine max]KAG5079975.1 hypothetical protein JHK86_004040 [Glycine max]RZC24837.1 hypothetical protein D0Y65_003838 [Glycine soja]
MDCKVIVDKVNNTAIDSTKIWSIISECRKLLVQNPNIRIHFIMRQSNDVVHSIARGAIFHARFKVYHYVPTCIVQTFINELM